MENTEVKKTKDSSFSKILNKYFHHLDRGSHLRSEVLCGIIVFLVSICLLFVNMQLCGKYILGDLTLSSSPADQTSIDAAKTYVSIYQGSLLVSFISALLIGLIARLPLVQVSFMGLSSCFIGFVTGNSGLTYYNLLFISFISSIIYAIIAGVPFIKNKIIKAIPKVVLHALPLVSGLFLIYIGVTLSGFVSTSSLTTGNLATNGISSSIFGLAKLSGVTLYAFIAVIFGFVVYMFLRATKAKHPISFSFLCTIGLFLLISIFGLLKNNFSTTLEDSYMNFGRIWLIAGSQANPNTPFADSSLTYCLSGIGEIFSNFGNVFTKGCDFSSYEGSPALLVVSTILSTVLFQFVDPFVVIEASKDDLSEGSSEVIDLENDNQKLYWINSGMNVIAPFFGSGAVTISKTSLIATKDKAKSGIVPIVAAIGYLISMFAFAFPALLATSNYTIGSMNEFNYFAYGNGGLIYLIQGASFGIADAVVVIIGLLMIEKSIVLLKDDEIKYLPVIVGLIAGLLINSLSLGILISMAYILVVDLFEPLEENKDKNFFVSLFLSCKNNYKKVNFYYLGLFVYSLLAVCL